MEWGKPSKSTIALEPYTGEKTNKKRKKKTRSQGGKGNGEG